MQEQKYKYFIDGKEVDNRTDYLNATMSGDYVSYFDGDSVFSVSFNSFFGKNIYSNKMIKREVNGHLSDVLKGSSTRHKSQNGETHKELTVEDKLKIAEELKKEAMKQLNITLEDIKIQASQSYYTTPEKKEDIKNECLERLNLQGLNTDTTLENVAYLMSSKNKKQLYKRFAKISAKKENKAEGTEQIVMTTITIQTNPEQAEKIKETVKEFNNQNSAEKNEYKETCRSIN